MDKKIVISMLSSADKVEGQGAGSVYLEQVNLVEEGASDLLTVEINSGKEADIIYSCAIDSQNYLRIENSKNTNVCHVYFLPDTLDGSIQFPRVLFSVLKKYMISLYKTTDYLTVVNPIFMRELEKYGVTRKKMIYIPSYVSKERFRVKLVEQCNAIHEQYRIKTDEFVVTGVRQVQTRKGTLDSVDATKELPDVRFVRCRGFLFGKATDGHEGLKKVVRNPPASVQFPGIIPRNGMNNIYNMADILFTPSYNELFPMTILEAVGLHRPMVLRSLELYEDILFKKYQMTDNNDNPTEPIRGLHEDPAYYAHCVADSAYISEYCSKENVLSTRKEFYTRIYEELQKREQGQGNAAFVLWQEGS